MEAEDEQDRRDNHMLTIANLLRQHATLIQATNAEVQGMKQVILQITDKIGSLHPYAKAVDNRLTDIRDGIRNRYELTFVDLSARVHELERSAQEVKVWQLPESTLLDLPSDTL